MDRQRGRSRHHLTVSGGVAVVSPPGQSEEAPATAGRWLWAAGLTAAGVALFLAYLRLTNTYPEDSDQANLGLQAWDMLHGNRRCTAGCCRTCRSTPPSCRSTCCSS